MVEGDLALEGLSPPRILREGSMNERSISLLLVQSAGRRHSSR